MWSFCSLLSVEFEKGTEDRCDGASTQIRLRRGGCEPIEAWEQLVENRERKLGRQENRDELETDTKMLRVTQTGSGPLLNNR